MICEESVTKTSRNLRDSRHTRSGRTIRSQLTLSVQSSISTYILINYSSSTFNIESMSSTQGRKRSRLACETCRDLKRKCDGNQPCGACVRFEYECTYKTPANKKRKTVEPDQAPPLPSPPVHVEKEVKPCAASPHHLQSLEANSGAAFLRRLALRLDPKSAPRMHTFSWNAFLGARRESLIQFAPLTLFK